MKKDYKKQETPKKDQPIGYDLDVIEQMINDRITQELVRIPNMRPLIDTLHEYDINGMKALSFITRFIQLTAEYQAEIQED